MSTDSGAKPTILLVHGAWHGPWSWDRLAPELESRGWNVRTVQLPSASADLERNAGMYDDARAVRAALEAIGGPTTVLAHSYGGIPVTEAAGDAGNVDRIIYLSAFQLDVGDSLAGQSGGQLPAGDIGTIPPNPEPLEYFYNGVPADAAEWAAKQLVPQSVRSFSEPLTRAAWRTVPSTYFLGEQDRAVPLDFQRAMAARSSRTRLLPSGHSAFLSMPAELADAITAERAR